jgi:hypothetical protein
MLSMGLFIVCLIEFLLLRSFASPTFFLLTAIVLLDAMAGMVVTIVSARRDFDVAGLGGGGCAERSGVRAGPPLPLWPCCSRAAPSRRSSSALRWTMTKWWRRPRMS